MRVGNQAMVFPLVDCWETPRFSLVRTELATHLDLKNARVTSWNWTLEKASIATSVPGGLKASWKSSPV